MKQVLLKNGQVTLIEVPAPMVEAGAVLVQVFYSCISVGTEMSMVKAAGKPLWQRAMEQPEKAMQLLEIAKKDGLAMAIGAMKNKAQVITPIGYSCAGVVLAVGEQVTDIQIGDKVACGGGTANHAEIVNVPRNLVVKVPDDVPMDIAATTTLGSIALQGVRRANPTLGETFVVLGLGIIGQITAQLLWANGCCVIGAEIDQEKIELAKSIGLDLGINLSDGSSLDRIAQLTDGYGADCVIITAATTSDEVVSNAFKMCRRKGRVVLVGDVGLNLQREDFYAKEIDFLISASYGPGRYDRNYEEKGLDYPYGYVRWTENRNMLAYLRLIANGRIDIKPLISTVFDLNEAANAYAELNGKGKKPLSVLLSYPNSWGAGSTRVIVQDDKASAVSVAGGKIGVAVVGAGSFAKETHLPNIKTLSNLFSLRTVLNRNGANALATAERFGAKYATTDLQQVLDDPDIQLLIVATRHNLHAEITLRALKAGKHVLVEKPLALNREELQQLTDYYALTDASSRPVLLTGFNRRFSSYGQKIKERIRDRQGPVVINYQMNAGFIPSGHWIQTEEGGGRNIGEACHIYDLFTFLTEAKVKDIKASAIASGSAYYGSNDNFVATIAFADGSIANLTYTALGNDAFPKERLEVFCDGKILLLDNYQSLTDGRTNKPLIASKKPEKGHLAELEALAHIILKGGRWPIPLWQQVQATEISLQVEELIMNGRVKV